MSSSSAYNNVLLKTAQTQAVNVPKRDFHNDSSSADFSQTFIDINSGAQSRIELAKIADKKATRVEHGQKAETGDARKLAKERVDEEKLTRKKVDEKIDKEKLVKESRPKEKVRSETADHAVANKKSGGKVDAVKEGKKASESTDELVVSDASTMTTTCVTEQSSSSFTLTTALLTDAESELIPTDLNSHDESGLVGSGGENELAVGLPQALDGKAPVALDAQAAMLISKTSVLKSSENPLNQTPGASQENPDAMLDAADALIAEKTLASSTKEANATDALAKTGAQQTDASEDAKTVFEKMLQNVSKSVVREEGATLNPLQNNNTHSSSSLADSFARFSDPQSPATRGFVVQTAVPVPVGQPQWSQAVGEKVLWLAAQNVSSAEINLHPKDLGPMQVRVSVNQEQTSVSFTSHHPMVREVLDQNLNRLRDMFSEQGLNLVNVDVSDKSFSRQQGEGKEQQGHSGTNSLNEEEAVTAISTIVQPRLVDHYA